MYELYDIVAVAIVTLALTGFVFTWDLNLNERYLLNLEYYSLESLLNSKINGKYVYEMILEDDLDKEGVKSLLDNMIPKGYFYLFEIPEYNFRVTNLESANSLDYCIQVERIYPINYKFGDVHLIFGIWSKNQKFRVIKCEG